MRLGDHRAARLPLGAEPGRARDVLEGQRPARARAHHRHAADRAARDRQPRVEGALRHRPGQHAEQLRHERRAADASRAARLPGAVLRRPRDVDQGAASRDHAERGVSAERRSPGRGLRQGRRQPALLARQPPPHERRADSRLGAVRLGRARHAHGRTVDAAHAARRPPHDLRHASAATSSTSSCSSSTSRARARPPNSASRPTCRCSGCSS